MYCRHLNFYSPIKGHNLFKQLNTPLRTNKCKIILNLSYVKCQQFKTLHNIFQSSNSTCTSLQQTICTPCSKVKKNGFYYVGVWGSAFCIQISRLLRDDKKVACEQDISDDVEQERKEMGNVYISLQLSQINHALLLFSKENTGMLMKFFYFERLQCRP